MENAIYNNTMTVSPPAASIIVPIYKVERYLEQCVDSILAQTLRDIEVVLVDDGSPDGCPAMCDAYAARDSRVRVIHQENGGYGKAVNAGLAVARAPYVGIVEPDDWIEPDMYEKLLAAAQGHDADVAKCWFYDFLDVKDGGHDTRFPFTCPPPVNKPFRIGEYPVFLFLHPSVWTCLYRREFLERCQIRVKEVPGAGWTDNLFQVQTLCQAERIVYIDDAYYHWRRVNVESADDLRDYRIPFERSDEIHAWLAENGLDTPETLASLYARELSYVLIVSRMKNIDDMADCCRRIKAMCGRMDKQVLRQAPLNRKTRKAYKLCMLEPRLLIWSRQLRRWFKERSAAG